MRQSAFIFDGIQTIKDLEGHRNNTLWKNPMKIIVRSSQMKFLIMFFCFLVICTVTFYKIYDTISEYSCQETVMIWFKSVYFATIIFSYFAWDNMKIACICMYPMECPMVYPNRWLACIPQADWSSWLGKADIYSDSIGWSFSVDFCID